MHNERYEKTLRVEKVLMKILAACLFFSLLNTMVVAQVVTLASGSQGSLAYNSGQAVAKVANNHGVLARPQPISGFLPLLNQGEVDFGFANGVESIYAYTGTGNYYRKNKNLRVVGVMFPLTTGIMVAEDTGIKNLSDLKAKASSLRIASQYTASTTISYYILGALANGGMAYDDFKRVPVSNFVKGIHALGDGLVDVTLISMNSGAGKQVEAKLLSRGGLRYVSLDPSPEAVTAFKKYLPSASIIRVEKNENVPGLKRSASNLISIPWLLLTHKDAPQEMVYNMTKIIAENNTALAATFNGFKKAEREKMAQAEVVPYHPGAIQYYREAGIELANSALETQ